MYDIKANTDKLAITFVKELFEIKRNNDNSLTVALKYDDGAELNVGINYGGNGIFVVDPHALFSSSQLGGFRYIEKYSKVCLILSQFNVASHKRYIKG